MMSARTGTDCSAAPKAAPPAGEAPPAIWDGIVAATTMKRRAPM